MKSLLLINPTGLQALNLSEVIPQIESILKAKLMWYLLDFGGEIDEQALGFDLGEMLGPKRRELTTEILNKFDYGPFCQYHEGSVIGFEENQNFQSDYTDDFLIKNFDICISYDHLNTAAITAKRDFLIDELLRTLTKLDRYPSYEDSSGQKIKLPMLPAEGVLRSD